MTVDPRDARDLTRPADGAADRVRNRLSSELDPASLREVLRQHGFELAPAARALVVGKNTLARHLARTDWFRRAGDLDAAVIQRALQEHGGVPAAAAALEVSERALRQRITRLQLGS